MPKPVPLKKVAYAMLNGIQLAYRNKLQDSKREVLYDILDDMAVALTAYAVRNKNKRIMRYAWILGELSDHIDIPLPTTKRRKR